MLGNWAREQTVHARVHAEIRIILHLGPLSPNDHSVHPIGVGKHSCLSCALWIASHNRIFGTRWMTSESHGYHMLIGGFQVLHAPMPLKQMGGVQLIKLC